jgi:hypothetical protein
VRLGREAHHIADRPDDLRGQYGTYAEDLGKGGAGSLYLRFDAPVEVRDLSIQRTDSKRKISEANRPCRRLNARVRSATRSSRLSESRRSASEPTSGSTAASRSLREAARAVARASSPSFLRALPAKLESTRTRAESLGGTSTTHSPAATNLPARCLPRGRWRSPPLRATLGVPLRPAFEGSQAGAVLREGSALDEPADFVDHRDGDRRFMGIDPDQDLHERTSVSVGPLPIGARRTFRLRALLPYLF